jgi:hypothetical protein
MSVAKGAARGSQTNRSGSGGQTNKNGSGGFSVWTAIAGGLGGAIVVGAIWGIVSVTSQTPSSAVAIVNGQPITQATLTSTLANQYGKSQLEQMIENRLVDVAAKARHLTASASAEATAEEAIEEEYGITSSADMTSFLQENGLTQAQFNTILKNQVLEQELSVYGIKVTNNEIAAYYKKNKAADFTTSKTTGKGKDKKTTKTVEPLSKVKSTIITDIKTSKALSASDLLAKLAKEYKLTIPDKTYKGLVSTIENPSTSSTTTGG